MVTKMLDLIAACLLETGLNTFLSRDDLACTEILMSLPSSQ